MDDFYGLSGSLPSGGRLEGAAATVGFTPEVVAAALENIYRTRFDLRRELEPNLLEATRGIFAGAVDEGAGDSPDMDGEFRRALVHSADVFAAFRVHRTQQDIAARMLDEEGRLKSFSRFARDVQPYLAHQNRAWLRTEYDTAVQRAHQAARWKQFEAERDVLPNLRWEPSTSPTPGADHRVFWNTVRPIDDPFWSAHRPGDRWNCKCSLEATDDEPTAPPADAGEADRPVPGLDNNPGRDGTLINDRHPYFPRSCAACPLAKNRLAALWAGLKAGGKKDCMECPWVDRAINRAELMGLNVQADKPAFRKAQGETRDKLGETGKVVIDDKRYYSGHLYFGEEEMRSIVAHCFNALELEAARQLPAMLPKLKNGRYEPINMGRKNYRKKIRQGVRNFVVYELKIGGDAFVLKCEAINHAGIMKEHPYSLMMKRE